MEVCHIFRIFENRPLKLLPLMKTIRQLTLAIVGLTLTTHICAQVQQTVFVPKPGTLAEMLTKEEAGQITSLTLQGKINAIDFKYLRDEFKQLRALDLSHATISRYAGKKGTYPDRFYVYPANCIPAYAFCTCTGDSASAGNETLRHVILPESIRNIEDAAFKGCNNLKICQIRKTTPPNLLKEALADSITAIFVPEGCGDTYRAQDNWKTFAIVEGESSGRKIHLLPKGSLAGELQKKNIRPQDINFLTLTGQIDEEDFTLIRNDMPNLIAIDLSGSETTTIPAYAFTQKKFLLRVRLPHGLKTIGQRAFSGCGRLSGTLVLPPGVTAIEYGAFIGCTKLQKVLATGSQIVTLGENLFGDGTDKLVYQAK